MQKWIAALMMALTGAILFAAFVLQDIKIHPEMAWHDLPWSLILRYAGAMTLGGALSGLVFSGLFGRNGFGGWILAILGGVLGASISGLFGSAFGLVPDLAAGGISTTELLQIAAGILVLPLSVIEEPLLGLVLTALVIATHILCKRARRRDQRT
jgi:hypothetical protein